MNLIEETALNALQERIGVRFKDVTLLERALTHRSAAMDDPFRNNERLEFVGDSVVGVVVCESLYRLFPHHSEGELAKSKAYVVSEASLAEAAHLLGLEAYVRMSSGEASSGGRRRRSILADSFEALIAAIYLDSGIRAARRVVRQCLLNTMRAAIADQHRGDYKSSLQERIQALYRMTPLYRIIDESGREHDKTFTVEALLDEEVIGTGHGKSKKEAEQAAAHNALLNMPSFSHSQEPGALAPLPTPNVPSKAPAAPHTSGGNAPSHLRKKDKA